MEIKNTILNKKDKELLEEVKLKFGKIVSSDQLKEVFGKKYSNQEALKRISFLSKVGWLLRIKRGLYVLITDIRSLSLIDVSEYSITQRLNRDSYISFENSLQYYAMFNQMLKTISAVTYNRSRKYSFKNIEINFIKFKKSLYFGFKEYEFDVERVKIAEKEKAILDMLYIRNDDYTINLVWEIISNNKSEIDFKKLIEYTKQFNFTVIRKIGFLLDNLGIESDELYNIIKSKRSYSRLTNDSLEFNAKWGLYIDNSLIG